tara:strand:+ start:2236 stop:2415 length:180 start_codon:yes stop_codon:yes gene_type:complete
MWDIETLRFDQTVRYNDGEPSHEELLLVADMAQSTVEEIVNHLRDEQYFDNLEYELRYN